LEDLNSRKVNLKKVVFKKVFKFVMDRQRTSDIFVLSFWKLLCSTAKLDILNWKTKDPGFTAQPGQTLKKQGNVQHISQGN